MSETVQIVIGALAGGLIGSTVVAGYFWLDYRIWLRRFRREYKIERDLWFQEHQQCCELDESYLAETERLVNG